MMVRHAFALLATLALSCSTKDSPDETLERVIADYSEWASATYATAVARTVLLEHAVEALVREPSEENLRTARARWIHARQVYARTEVLRFYDGPIDAVEGLINAWPVDESYLDSIVSDPERYPSLDAAALRALNEKDGEKNIATGWHAIEYLLWGPDESATGPGHRAAAFFAEPPHAARRCQVLRVLVSALREDLDGVHAQWKRGWFLQLDKKRALHAMFRGAIELALNELAGERMGVAIETRDQEEEQSCFSDTTRDDHVGAVDGISIVFNGAHGRLGLSSLVRQKDASLATTTTRALQAALAQCKAIPQPFDQAILSVDGRARVEGAIDALGEAAQRLRESARALNVPLDVALDVRSTDNK